MRWPGSRKYHAKLDAYQRVIDNMRATTEANRVLQAADDEENRRHDAWLMAQLPGSEAS